jgi:catechol 2,3-dioxygenase-like lactoylglutathione lyase family enzyme
VLGRFLEFTVRAPRILESWQFWQRLGFTPATVGETWSHGYAVVTDGRIHVGLHDADVPHPALTWVRPELARHLPAFEAAGIEFTARRLADDDFHEAEFEDPDRHLLRLLEARTYSPPARPPASTFGWFEECMLPVRDPERSRAWWEGLGFVTVGEGDAPWPHYALTSDTLNVGLYRTAEFDVPVLRFVHDDVRALREQLAAVDVEPETRLPRALDPLTHLLVVAPDGTHLLAGPEAG